ncbi:hypothetical protein [Nonomuraea sp. NPDC050786]
MNRENHARQPLDVLNEHADNDPFMDKAAYLAREAKIVAKYR